MITVVVTNRYIILVIFKAKKTLLRAINIIFVTFIIYVFVIFKNKNNNKTN